MAKELSSNQDYQTLVDFGSRMEDLSYRVHELRADIPRSECELLDIIEQLDEDAQYFCECLNDYVNGIICPD